MKCSSPCADNANNPDVPEDTYDADDDGNPTTPIEPTPDLSRYERIVNSTVDRGAFESHQICLGDVAWTWGVVDVDDLLPVINNWGNCPGLIPGCPGDTNAAQAPCGDGVVNNADLLAVLDNWGSLCDGTSTGESIPASIDECMDRCSQHYATGRQRWAHCVESCVQTLCDLGIIDCD